MRITFNSLPDSLVTELNSLASKQNKLQNQAATGKRISQLEDDPAAMRTVMDLQAQDSQYSQYRQNISSMQSQATSSYNAIQSLQTISQRAGEIATSVDSTTSPQAIQAYTIEVGQLLQNAVQLMNSQYQGQYLFGGTATEQPPFVATTDANGDITSVDYQGNTSVASVNIGPGTSISVQTLGANTTGSGPAGLVTDPRSGADLFNHLISLYNHLKSGDAGAVGSQDQAALTKDEDHLTLQMGLNGVMQSQLSAADALAQTQSTSLEQSISQNSDADLAQTLTQLSAAQTAYQAALQSGASLLNQNQTLLSYIQ